MPLLEDLLLRFRRVWAPPGPVAGQPGVPEDAGEHLEEELRELSAQLNAIDVEGKALLHAAQTEAAEIVAAANAESAHIVEEARSLAPSVRAGRAAQRASDREAEMDRLIAEAETQAVAMRARARPRMQPIIDKIAADAFVGVRSSEVTDARVMGGR